MSAVSKPTTASPLPRSFAALIAIAFLCFANLAFFYGFYNYLAELGIPSVWRGPLMAMEPVMALIARPFLSLAVTAGNAARAMTIGAATTTLALLAYPFADTVPAIAVVRLAHGIGYVVLASGVVAAYTQAIPEGRAAWAFGLLSLTSLLPAALLPSLIEVVQPLLPGTGDVYAAAAVLIVLVFPLLRLARGDDRATAGQAPPRPSLAEIRDGLGRPGVIAMAAGYLVFVAAHTIVYFFAKSWCLALGAANPGVFFLCVNATVIAVRVLGMGRLDSVNPARVAGLNLVGLAVVVPCFALTGLTGAGIAGLYALGVVYGLFLGIGMPLFNAAMYRLSRPALRAINANLMMTALDAGFILGPLLGGGVLAAGTPLPWLFVVAGGLMLLAGALILPVARLTPRPAAR